MKNSFFRDNALLQPLVVGFHAEELFAWLEEIEFINNDDFILILGDREEFILTIIVCLAYQFFSEQVPKAKLRCFLLRRTSHPDDSKGHDGDDDDGHGGDNKGHGGDDDDGDDDDDDGHGDDNKGHDGNDDDGDDDYLVMLLLMLQPSEGWLMISDWLSTGRSTFVLIIISSG